MIYALGMIETKIIYHSKYLRAVLFKSQMPSKTLYCEFDYLDNKRDGFPTMRVEPSMCDRGFDVLRIDTSSNNWFLSQDIPLLLHALNELATAYRSSVSVCFSMGVMAALMFSKVLKIENIMAFSPVVSIFEDDIADRRFKSFRKNIEYPKGRHMWKEGSSDIKGGVFYDPFVPVDVHQARLINQYYAHLRPLALPFGGHPCTRVIKDVCGFKSIQDLVVRDEFDANQVRQLHRICRRQSGVYQSNINKRCDVH